MDNRNPLLMQLQCSQEVMFGESGERLSQELSSLGREFGELAGDDIFGIVSPGEVLPRDMEDFSQGLSLSLAESDNSDGLHRLYANQDLLNANALAFVPPQNVGGMIVAEPVVLGDAFAREFIAAQEIIPGPSKYLAVRKAPLSKLDIDKLLFPTDEVIPTQDFGGKFNFDVSLPADSGAGKKWLYSAALNRVYCKEVVNVPFDIKFDFNKITNMSDIKIRVLLLFEDDDMKGKAVVRCDNCKQTENRSNNGINSERLPHMVRPYTETPEIRYYENQETKRCYLLLPGRTPEPGVNHITANLKFVCSNSHLKNLQKQQTQSGSPAGTASATRNIRILFTLHHAGLVYGRASKKLRICSAPHRDHQKDLGKRKVKEENSTDETKTAEVKSNKRVKHSPKQEADLVKETKQAVRTVVTTAPSGQADEDVSSSQESMYSCHETDTKIPLRTFMTDLKHCLKHMKSKDVAARNHATLVLQHVRLLHNMCKEGRRLGELPVVKEEQEERSPDGGFHDGGGQE